MDTTLAPATRRVPVRGLDLAIREWTGDKSPPFLLVHGLASNARTWDAVASELNRAGHRVVAVDQRGHGLSDKPDDGYGFDEVTADLHTLIGVLDLQQPIVAGQSWGGNVVLDFAARWPDALRGLVLVDGGFIELGAQADSTWERISVDLKPPPLIGMPRDQMVERMRSFHPDWSDDAIEMTLANFETLPDGTIRPWLSLERHMKILRALWEQRPSEIYPEVKAPTLIAVADNQGRGRTGRREDEVAQALAGLTKVEVEWFRDTAHDIHVHRPKELSDWILKALDNGFFDQGGEDAQA